MTFIKFPVSDKFSSVVLLCLPTSAPSDGQGGWANRQSCLEKRRSWTREEEEGEQKDALKITKKKRPKKEKTQTNHPKPTKSGKSERKTKRQKKKLVEIVWKAFYAPTLQSAVFKISWKKKKRSGVFTVVSVNVLVTQLILYCTVLRLLHFLLYFFPSITVFSVCLEEVCFFFFNPFLPQSWV